MDQSAQTPVQPSIDEWTAGQTQYRPAFTEELTGRTIDLVGPGDAALSLYFVDEHTLRWSLQDDTAISHETRYDATLVRPDIFLVDYLDDLWPMPGTLQTHPRLLTWALDLGAGRATLAVSGVVSVPHAAQGALLRARTDHSFWSTTAGAPPHPRSNGLVGRRVLWRYSETDEYEHIYLNGSAFAWQCLRGLERGLSELDPTRAYEIADGLYFFHWAEHDLVVESALFIDLHDVRTFGRFYALDTDDLGVRHHQFGARGELLGTVEYPGPADHGPI